MHGGNVEEKSGYWIPCMSADNRYDCKRSDKVEFSYMVWIFIHGNHFRWYSDSVRFL
jgi:hypothetical protein